jgi:hypothetical protein
MTSVTIIFETVLGENFYFGKATLNRLQNFLVSNVTSPDAEEHLKTICVSPAYKGESNE